MISTPLLNVTEMMQQAQQGDPKAIAYWVNLALLPLQCCAKVVQQSPDQLTMIVLCRQLPDREQLLSTLGDRLRRLSSNLSVVVIRTQLAGSNRMLWQDQISLPHYPQPSFRISRLNHWLHSMGSACSEAVEQVFPQNNSIGSVAIHPFLDQLQHSSRQRNRWLGGSAMLAFLLGCGVEAMSYRATTVHSWEGQWVSLSGLLGQSEDTEYVQAALETVPIVDHPAAADGATLSFSSASWLDGASPFLPIVQTDVALTYFDPMAIAPVVSETAKPLLITDEMRSQAQETLMDNGIDIVSLPNVDTPTRSRRIQLQRILDSIDEAGLHTIGAGVQPAIARRPQILNVSGQRIAYLSYTSAGETAALQTQITADVQAIRPNVDWVIVNFHWRDALADYPSAQQIQLAHHAVDHGTDLVVGYHPQVLQGAEIYRDRAIAYSVGNFDTQIDAQIDAQIDTQIDAQAPADTIHNTAMLKVSLRQEQMRLEFLPVRIEAGQPRLATDRAADEILTYLDHASALFDKPMRSPIILDRHTVPDRQPASETNAIDASDILDEPAPDKPSAVDSDSFIDPASPVTVGD